LLFEGLSEAELLDLPSEHLVELVLTGNPIVFRVGTATVLGEFKRDGDRLVIQLAQIDGGGEGILLAVGSLVRKYAARNRIQTIEWIVLAATCARPNLKLRRVLERRGFQLREVPGIGAAYYLLDTTPQ
jgi:hypothetical protein